MRTNDLKEGKMMMLCTSIHTMYILISVDAPTHSTKFAFSASLIPLFSDVKQTGFCIAYFAKIELKSDKKKYQGNADKFISNQLKKFGLVLSKNKNRPKIVTVLLSFFIQPFNCNMIGSGSGRKGSS